MQVSAALFVVDDNFFLPVSSHGASSVCGCVHIPSPYKDTSPIGLGLP